MGDIWCYTRRPCCAHRTPRRQERPGADCAVRQTSQAAAVTWKREIDFLYVDGDHRYEAVVSDIRAFVPFVRHGGLLAFHDYKLSGKEGVRRAVDELVAPHHARLFQAGSLVCFRIHA